MIYRLAVKMLENPQDAEDVLQETFIKAYRACRGSTGDPACPPGCTGSLQMKR